MALLLGTVFTQDQTVDQLIQNFDDLVNNIQGTTHPSANPQLLTKIFQDLRASSDNLALIGPYL